MALPAVKSLADCVDYEKTVAAFLPQLWELPQHISDSFFAQQSFVELYKSTNPLISSLAFSLFLFPVFLVLSEINGNYSQVDRMWGILPSVYNVHYLAFAHLTGQPTERNGLICAVSLIWTVCSDFSVLRTVWKAER